MTKKEVIRSLQRYNNGGGVMTLKQYAEWADITTNAAAQHLTGMAKYRNKYYFVEDLAEQILTNMSKEGER